MTVRIWQDATIANQTVAGGQDKADVAVLVF